MHLFRSGSGYTKLYKCKIFGKCSKNHLKDKSDKKRKIKERKLKNKKHNGKKNKKKNKVKNKKNKKKNKKKNNKKNKKKNSLSRDVDLKSLLLAKSLLDKETKRGIPT